MAYDVLADLEARNLIAQTTDINELRAALTGGSITFYCGFDPTAPALHLGNLAQIVTMRRLQNAGHRPLALVGGATGLIGDPSGKTAERSLNSTDIVNEWVERISSSMAKFFETKGKNAVVFVNNFDWTKNYSAITLLRDIGKHFSVNRMLDRDAVASRLNGSGISYTEFSYVILQSLDYVELFRLHDCVLQIGGSDQWGNITSGCELVRKTEGKTVHALTTPLITKADGTKFGKTESGTVWIDSQLTSPYAFYQFWLNADDRDLQTYFNTYSFKSVAEITEIITKSNAEPHLRIGQRELANEITAMVHGEDAATNAASAGAALFGQADLNTINVETLESALREAGLVEINKDDLIDGKLPSISDLFVRSEIVNSKSAARRAVEEGGAYLNNVKITESDAPIEIDQLIGGQLLVLRRGKKTVAGVKFLDK
jgi:tyrosyl-tRNA synthetase